MGQSVELLMVTSGLGLNAELGLGMWLRLLEGVSRSGGGRKGLSWPPLPAAPMGEDRCPNASRWGWGHLQWEGPAHWNTPQLRHHVPQELHRGARAGGTRARLGWASSARAILQLKRLKRGDWHSVVLLLIFTEVKNIAVAPTPIQR